MRICCQNKRAFMANAAVSRSEATRDTKAIDSASRNMGPGVPS